ncbi:MAG: NADH-quinone oxidoreductase subunit M [Phenylobacterium sp. RIFCSPHIGHO2_01_FULL_69_31]|jgi:NADH-quinone oxidoreductase subunit M|uniref:NADH-quinone oxidoreductase subunit M n=1 Tax=Phenylobacterium sp. RIFCSPHIGHO2_01_FULL_69_31 TaxID=1801944 RepID=UPI0008C91835|nr:NADH-quinone oxidoreductase subunit M [Phenylobacterium sp. RIFCSPHIGHO2_01_FULL_69_31]OHB28042.1 MAG: NADH-quinone oxidoreductase subunit M [Phenylobacterium sp. RIFCSPHIGHO2_01_FULL_69_31]
MPLLSLITYAPLAGVVAILALKLFGGSEAKSAETSKWVALIVTLATLALSVLLVARFDPANPGFQFLEETPWFMGLSYRMGVDGISILFVLLTAFLMPLCIMASWRSIETRVHEYLIAFLVLETLVIGVFCALDLVLFYIFFEFGLVPMFLIIGIWGGARRVYAAFKFFLYTLLGSVLMLAAILFMIGISGTSSIPELMTYSFAPEVQTWLWLAFFASFAVKMPMWPVHTWLPDAHVEAPTAGSVILAGILLKMGGYGFLRFSLPMFPNASDYFTPLVFALSVIAVIYTSLVAFRQTDVKKLIAYSSVAHMGLVTMGIFSGNAEGEQGAIYQMLSHGVISGALFLCVGVIYDRMHTREIKFYGGLVTRMPVYAAVFMLFTMGNVGLPGTSGFVGEILSMTGVYQVSTWTAILAATGVILSAVYMLTLYRAVVFGPMTNPKLEGITDLNWREVAIFAPLIVSTLYMGVQPNSVFNLTQASVDQLVRVYQAAIGG